MYYVRNGLSAVEPVKMPDLPEVSLFPQISDTTKKWVVYGSVGLVAISFLVWLAARK
jgi:hypothetical protein